MRYEFSRVQIYRFTSVMYLWHKTAYFTDKHCFSLLKISATIYCIIIGKKITIFYEGLEICVVQHVISFHRTERSIRNLNILILYLPFFRQAINQCTYINLTYTYNKLKLEFFTTWNAWTTRTKKHAYVSKINTRPCINRKAAFFNPFGLQ